MSNSNWFDDSGQNGNFSNGKKDTFDINKRYIGVRLQQGVPLLDRDWNELEDIRRNEEMILRKYYIGDGAPHFDEKGTRRDGFKIKQTKPSISNDFIIATGRCLVDGFEAVNFSDINYSKQDPIPGVTDFPRLNVPQSGTRMDTVYIDLWIEEVFGSTDPKKGDPSLLNPQDVDMETCIRHKVEWRVRVLEGGDGNPPQEEAFHHHYVIGQISRDSTKPDISDEDIKDLRNRPPINAITVDSDNNLIIKGSIKTTRPDIPLRVIDRLTVGPFNPPQGPGNIAATGSNAQLSFVPQNVKAWPHNAPGEAPKAGDRFSWYSPDGSSARLWTEEKGDLLCVTNDGKVGIGTTTPGAGLHIGSGDLGFIDQIRLILQPPVHTGGPWQFNIRDVSDPSVSNLDIGYGNSKKLTIDSNGKIGIGTTAPQISLHVEGDSIHSGGFNAGLSFANRDINSGAFVDKPKNGERWVWYAGTDFVAIDQVHIPKAYLWCNTSRTFSSTVRSGHVLSIDVVGNMDLLGGLHLGGDIFGGGNIIANGQVQGSNIPPSDVRLKTNIKPLPDVLDKLEKIQCVSFEWNERYPFSRQSGQRQVGLIAQEVESVFPEIVTTWGNKGYLGINYGGLTGVLVEAVKELKAEIEVLKERISDMQGAAESRDQSFSNS